MSRTFCPQENVVARMARTGLWDEATTRHARECAACREVSAAAVRMGSIAGRLDAVDALPEAGLVWWKHELMEHYRQREQAARPVRIMEGLTATLAVAALAVAFTAVSLGIADALPGGTESLTADWLTTVLGMVFASPLSQGALTTLATAAAIGAGIVYPLWRER